jgi:hypothetical protein
MGDDNQGLYLERFGPKETDCVLEVGSRNYGGSPPFRKTLTYKDYIGLDLSPGRGVDTTGDLTEGLCGLPPAYFSLIICCSVLEHVNRPWIMADNITRLMRSDGKLYVSVPFSWRFHSYPDDYFRFSHSGVASLFPYLKWSHLYYSTTVRGEMVEIVRGDEHIKFGGCRSESGRQGLPYLMVNMLGEKR